MEHQILGPDAHNKVKLKMLLCRMIISGKKKTGALPVYLNIYDLTPINGYAYWLGLGVYHSGVQVHGVEYAFSAHEHSTTGVFEVEPKLCPGFTFRKSILIGRTDMGAKEVRAFMEKLAREYSGNTYNLITRNCNHFCNDVCLRLTGKPIPKWVNRLARRAFIKIKLSQIELSGSSWMLLFAKRGLLCNCVLPASLNEMKVRHIKADDRVYVKKKLRSHSNRFISSSNQSHLSSCPSKSAKHRNSTHPSSPH